MSKKITLQISACDDVFEYTDHLLMAHETGNAWSLSEKAWDNDKFDLSNPYSVEEDNRVCDENETGSQHYIKEYVFDQADKKQMETLLRAYKDVMHFEEDEGYDFPGIFVRCVEGEPSALMQILINSFGEQ